MKCANPMCRSESMYFRSGSLHCIDPSKGPPAKGAEAKRRIVWLCRNCSDHWAVETWRPAGQQMRPRRHSP